MALRHSHRTSLYQGLSRIAPEEAVEEMLSHFPMRELDEPITRDHLRAELAELRAEVQRGFATLEQRLETRLEAQLDAKLDAGFAIADERTDRKLAALEIKLMTALHRQTRWTIATIVSTAVAAAAFLRYWPGS